VSKNVVVYTTHVVIVQCVTSEGYCYNEIEWDGRSIGRSVSQSVIQSLTKSITQSVSESVT
jgi:hypothetical protein